MDKKLLDNMSGQEIKELIDNGIITLQELQDSELAKILDFETEMLCHGSGDMDTIRQCAAILDERSKSNKLNKDEISDIICKAKSEHVRIIDADGSHSDAPRKRIGAVLKRIAIIAAAIMITITSTFAIAAAFDVDIHKGLKSLLGTPDGTTVNIDEFTFQNVDVIKRYESIQQMVEEENLDIMYPTRFPEGFDIQTVMLIDDGNGNYRIDICTNDANVGITIELDSSECDVGYDEIYEHNGKFYYISQPEFYWAFCYYKNSRYYITANTYEDLILIIDNMKE